jgi:hypothetical protein
MKNRYTQEKSKSKSLLKKLAIVILTIFVSFLTGYIIGLSQNENENDINTIIGENKPLLIEPQHFAALDREILLNEIDAKNIEKHLKYTFRFFKLG